jgi:hypothetical protein
VSFHKAVDPLTLLLVQFRGGIGLGMKTTTGAFIDLEGGLPSLPFEGLLGAPSAKSVECFLVLALMEDPSADPASG